ncbi:hypothetical protein [Treponema sp. Marseille-Q4132]|uniref:hypothetical protein n=1 Tax=Treponema sp. Marseille-Q4132 TaxID=2766701 RepID=UPI001652FF9A|nr:hypothetical protein [Treponema sp. Marseille-Q4132]QNL96560.1 hypothetical protein H9I35_08965 [Treponema sp. Marseille-Q4132]
MKICKIMPAAFASAAILTLMPLSAQNGTSSGSEKQNAPVTAPVMPTPPSMPTLSVPSMSAPHYTPGRNTATQRQTNDSQTGSAPAANETPTQTMQQIPSGKVQSTGQADANGSKNQSAVSAADLTALAKKGLLNNFYSLLGSSGTDALLQGGLSSGGIPSGGALPSSSNAMLEKILSELDNVKKQNAEAVKSNEEQPLASSARPGILRFIVNGYDVLSSCRTVYFSDVGEDGTFLLTGDRTYTANGQKRMETFYLLFRPAGHAGFSTQYKVECSVVQDYTNVHSFMYRLASLGNLTAVKTGNLVSMRTSDQNCRADLLIDIGSGK